MFPQTFIAMHKSLLASGSTTGEVGQRVTSGDRYRHMAKMHGLKRHIAWAEATP
jgi:hypothetical protein